MAWGLRARRAFLAGLMIALAAGPLPVLADALDRALARGTLRIGVAEFTPWTMKEGDRLYGHEIDIGRRVAGDLGVEPEFKLIAFGEIIAALHSGEIDIIAAGLAITPERALEMAFTRPYFRSGIGLATNTAATAEIGSVEALNAPEVTVAYVAETLAAGYAEVLFPKADLASFDNAREAEAAVVEGEAAVYLASLPEARFLALRNPDRVDLPVADALVGSAAGFGVAHGEARLLNWLDAWIVARTEDRWLSATYDFWFKSLDWETTATDAVPTGETTE